MLSWVISLHMCIEDLYSNFNELITSSVLTHLHKYKCSILNIESVLLSKNYFGVDHGCKNVTRLMLLQ